MLSVLDKVEARGMAKGIAKGEARGIAKGEARGIAKGKADTARRMLMRGLLPEQIADYTDLPLEEIEALRNPQA